MPGSKSTVSERVHNPAGREVLETARYRSLRERIMRNAAVCLRTRRPMTAGSEKRLPEE